MRGAAQKGAGQEGVAGKGGGYEEGLDLKEVACALA